MHHCISEVDLGLQNFKGGGGQPDRQKRKGSFPSYSHKLTTIRIISKKDSLVEMFYSHLFRGGTHSSDLEVQTTLFIIELFLSLYSVFMTDFFVRRQVVSLVRPSLPVGLAEVQAFCSPRPPPPPPPKKKKT